MRGRRFASLRGREAFRRLYRSGRRQRAGGIAVVLGPGEPGSARVAVVAKKDVGGAVRRNRAKRRLREALSQVSLAPGTDYVVVASGAVADASFEQLVEWVRAAVEERGE